MCLEERGKSRILHHSRTPPPSEGVRGASRITLRQKETCQKRIRGRGGRSVCAFTELQVTITAWGQGKRSKRCIVIESEQSLANTSITTQVLLDTLLKDRFFFLSSYNNYPVEDIFYPHFMVETGSSQSW